MEEQKNKLIKEEYSEVITPRSVLELIKPIIKDEFIATCRSERAGLKIKFSNGQQFMLTVTELK